MASIPPGWDCGEGMSEAAIYGGVFIGSAFSDVVSGPANPANGAELYDNAVFRIPWHTALAIRSRIRQFTFAGSAAITATNDPTTTLWSGSWSLVLKAAKFWRRGNIELANEHELCAFGGWHGVDEITGMEMWLGAEWFPPGMVVDELGRANASGKREVTFHEPFLNSVDTSPAHGFSFGRAVTDVDGNDLDNCPVVATLPATLNGSFDGSGATHFHLELGGFQDSDFAEPITGSATLNPTLWWGHDGRWDTATGARL